MELQHCDSARIENIKSAFFSYRFQIDFKTMQSETTTDNILQKVL